MKTSHILIIVLVIGISTTLICMYIKSQQETTQNEQRKNRKTVQDGFNTLQKVITEAVEKKTSGEKTNLVTELNSLKAAIKETTASTITVKVPTV